MQCSRQEAILNEISKHFLIPGYLVEVQKAKFRFLILIERYNNHMFIVEVTLKNKES